jgi:hypothetical protein
MRLISDLERRLEQARRVSDDAHFTDLMIAHLFLVKYYVALHVAAIPNSLNHFRLRAEHHLVRDDGLQ